MIIGLFAFISGIIILLRNIGIITVPFGVWELILPMFLIIIGFYLVVGSIRIKRLKHYKNIFRKGGE